MKLYYAPGACSLSVHITLQEAGFAFALEKVDLATSRTETDVDYTTINPNGYVPTLVLDDGEVLTEVPAILLYLADRADKSLAPPAGSMARYRLYSWLNSLHRSCTRPLAPCSIPTRPMSGKHSSNRRWQSVVTMSRHSLRASSSCSATATRLPMPIYSPCWAGRDGCSSILHPGPRSTNTWGASPRALPYRRRSRMRACSAKGRRSLG